MSDVQPATRQRRWRRWIGFSILALLFLLVGGHGFLGWWQEKQLDEEIASLRAKGEAVLPEDFKSKAIADQENAAEPLVRAAKAIDQSSKTLERFFHIVLELPLNQKELAIVRPALAENEKALAIVREAPARKTADWKIQVKSPLMLVLESSLKGQEDLSQLLCAAALAAHQDGRDAEALEFVLDLLRQSEAIEQAPTWNAHLLAIKVLHRALDAGEQLAPDLRLGLGGADAQKVRELIDKLLDESALREGLRSSLRFDRAKNVDVAKCIARGQVLGQAMPARSDLSMGGYFYKPLLMRDARLMLKHGTVLLGAIEANDFPQFSARMGEGRRLADQVDGNKKWYPLAAIAIPLDQALAGKGREYRTMCEGRMLATALAIRLYAAAHGEARPGKLEELVPKDLPAVPIDPYSADAKTLRYDQKRAVVYSVGENGTDEGGSEKSLHARIPYRWEQEDAVFHLTRQPRQGKSLYEGKDGGYVEDDSDQAR